MAGLLKISIILLAFLSLSACTVKQYYLVPDGNVPQIEQDDEEEEVWA